MDIHKYFKFKRGGFTILELVIAIFIFVAVVTLITTVTISLTRSSVSVQDSSASESVLLDATNRITRDVSYATRILRADPEDIKVETVENGKCRRSDWSVIPVQDDNGNPVMRPQRPDGSTDGQQRYDMVNTIEYYNGACPDDKKARFDENNQPVDPDMIPRTETKTVIYDFDRFFDGGLNETPVDADGNPTTDGALPVFRYFDKNDVEISNPDAPKSFIRLVEFTVANTTKDRSNPLKITTKAVPYAGGDPSENDNGVVVPVAPVLGARPFPLTLPEQPTFPDPDLQWIELTWTNPTPSITTGYILLRYSATEQGGLAVQTQIDLPSDDPDLTTFNDEDLPRGTCARYQVFAVTTKGLSAGSNFRDVCMPTDPVQNLVVRADNASVDSLSTQDGVYSNNRNVITGLIPGKMNFTKDTYKMGRTWVELEWDAVFAEGSAGLGYDIYMNGIKVAVLDGAGGAWDYAWDAKTGDQSPNITDYKTSVSRSVKPAEGSKYVRQPDGTKQWTPGEKITWGVWMPLDHNDKFTVVPFDFWQDNNGNAQKIDAFLIEQRTDMDSTQWGSTVNAVTLPEPRTVRHTYPDTNGQRVTLSWKASNVARGYRIYRSTMTEKSNKDTITVRNPENYNWVHNPTMEPTEGPDADSGWALVGETTANETTWTSTDPADNGIAPGTKYAYKVVAWNRPGMWPININWSENPEQWVNDRGGYDMPDTLDRHGSRPTTDTLKTETDFINVMSRTINTVYGVPSPAQPQCKVNMNDRTVAVTWPNGVAYPQTAQIDIHRAGSTNLSSPGKFVHTETTEYGNLGLYVNANNTPGAEGIVPGTETNVGRYNASGGTFHQTTVDADIDATPWVTVNSNIPSYPRSDREYSPFAPGASGQNAPNAGIDQNGGYWIVPNEHTRWGDSFKFTFRTINEAGESAARSVDCYIPMPVAADPGLYDNGSGYLNAKDNGPDVATTAEARYFNVPGVKGMQMNNYRVHWSWKAPNGAFTYTKPAGQPATNSGNRPDYAASGYEYWVYFEPIDRDAPSKGTPWEPGQAKDCNIEPEDLGGYPEGRGKLVKLPSDRFDWETVSKMTDSGDSANSQRAWDHDVWIYAVNLETGKRIMLSTSCHVKSGPPYVPPTPTPICDEATEDCGSVGPILKPTMELYGLPLPDPYTGPEASRDLRNQDLGMNLGRMAIDLYRSEYGDFDEIVSIKNIGTSWPNPVPKTYSLALCDKSAAGGNINNTGDIRTVESQYCNNLTKNPNNELAQRNFADWKIGMNTVHLLEELTPGFPYRYELRFRNNSDPTVSIFETNVDFTYPYRNLINAAMVSNAKNRPKGWWNESYCTNDTGFSHQVGNEVHFYFRRMEDSTLDTVKTNCQYPGRPGPLTLVGRQDYIEVDGVGRYPSDPSTHRTGGDFRRGGQTVLEGLRGTYLTRTVNPWHKSGITTANANPTAPSVSARRNGTNPTSADINGPQNTDGSASVTFSISSPAGCSMWFVPGQAQTNPASLEGKHIYQCSHTYQVDLPGVPSGAWINCGKYNLTCEWSGQIRTKTVGFTGAIRVGACQQGPGEDPDCYKDGVYASDNVTLGRTAPILPKPKPLPTPTPTPTKK